MTCQSADGFGVGEGEGFAAAGLEAADFALPDLEEAFFAEAVQTKAREIAPTMEKARRREAIIQHNMQDKCQKATAFAGTIGGYRTLLEETFDYWTRGLFDRSFADV